MDNDGPTSFTSCDDTLSAEPFYYHAASQRTYQECFSNPALSESTPTVAADAINAPFTAVGGLTLADEPAILARDYAIVDLGGQLEGAYRININTEADPSYAYCTGRGILVVDAPGFACRKNACESIKDNYIVFGSQSADNFCYHTCYIHTE